MQQQAPPSWSRPAPTTFEEPSMERSKSFVKALQVTDLKNSPPMLGKHRTVTCQAVAAPEFIAKKVFINVPWWYLAANTMMSPFLTQHTRSKFVFASQAKSAETLFRYIAPEQVRVQFGGAKNASKYEPRAFFVVVAASVLELGKHKKLLVIICQIRRHDQGRSSSRRPWKGGSARPEFHTWQLHKASDVDA